METGKLISHNFDPDQDLHIADFENCGILFKAKRYEYGSPYEQDGRMLRDFDFDIEINEVADNAGDLITDYNEKELIEKLRKEINF